MEKDDPTGKECTYVLDDQVGYILRQVSQRHAVIFQAASPDGLTPTQFSTLVRLHQTGPCSQNELGRATAMDVATIKGVIDRLKAKGFVKLTSYPGDRRRTLISLTPQSEAMIPALHAAGHRITDETLEPLTEEERVSFLALLRKLV
ncbi:MarR family winged helix-turn-helix transcriptional regulator [Oceaniglobus roseus]|uniref:MarR family winged helix-turn-helix transcriptional regulator n=1 Tax=Oceaniglobus roseus TaxID=1737570 RepID=UPI000C7E9E70|nr:MarR family transcriptional regulator [Kandeliimicrobium roseum]